MTATISATNGAGTSTPELVLSPYETAWQSRNVVHDLIGGGIAVSIVPPRPRAGVFDALYLTESDAFGCAELHQQPTTFTLTESDRPQVGMTYVIEGAVTVRLDEETQNVWIVTIGYQEVTP
jgi:hypothetical protein